MEVETQALPAQEGGGGVSSPPAEDIVETGPVSRLLPVV